MKKIEVELTQEHIDKAIAEIDAESSDVCRCCPVWQAVSEKLNNKNIEVGFYSIFNKGTTDSIYRLSETTKLITILNRYQWHFIKPQTIALLEKE